MSTVARRPRAAAGLALVLVALGWLVVGTLRRSSTSPGADPWLVTALAVAGAWLLLGALVAEQRARVSAAVRRRRPGLPLALAAGELTGAPAGPPAWESARTRASWSASVRHGWWPLVAVLGLAVAVYLPVHTYRQADAALGTTGVRVDGRVLDAHWAYEGRGGRPVADVAYTVNGTPHTAQVASPAPGALPRGTQLQLQVDPEHPDHLRAVGIPGTTSALEWWTTVGSLLTLALLVHGVAALARLWALRRTLASTPWTPAALAGRGELGILRTDAGSTPVRAPRRRLPVSRAQVVPARPGWVLAELPHGTHVELRLPRTVAEGERWLAALPAPVLAGPEEPPTPGAPGTVGPAEEALVGSGAGADGDEEVAAVEGTQVPRREAQVDA